MVYTEQLDGQDTVPATNAGVGTAEVGTYMMGDEIYNKNDMYDVVWLVTK